MHIVVFITAPNKKEAENISWLLLKERLVACVNIIENAHSMFWWQGKIDDAKEVLLIAKTRRTLFNKLVKKVRTAHSYKVPEIIALPVAAGNKKYLEWINASTR